MTDECENSLVVKNTHYDMYVALASVDSCELVYHHHLPFLIDECENSPRSNQRRVATIAGRRARARRAACLSEAHNIKNFKSQRWQTLLGFNAQRRLLLTGTPLQARHVHRFVSPHACSHACCPTVDGTYDTVHCARCC